MGPIQVGDTISFAMCRQSGSRSTRAHHMTIEALDIDYNLYDGPVGRLLDPANNCEFTFDAPGEYIIDDDLHRGAHGVAKFVVVDDANADGPTTYVLGAFVVQDGSFELRMGETAYFGYDAQQRIPTGALRTPSGTTFMIAAFVSSVSIVGNFNGLIDEVRIYNRALTEQEIKALFDAASGI